VIAGFPGSVVVTFAIAGYGRPDPVNGATLVGTGGVLRVDLAGSRLELAPAGAAAFDDVAIPDAERWTWRVEADFIGAIRDAEPVRLTDFTTGVRYMRFTDAVHEADATGTRVAL
jgi:predicted dehydrogenase